MKRLHAWLSLAAVVCPVLFGSPIPGSESLLPPARAADMATSSPDNGLAVDLSRLDVPALAAANPKIHSWVAMDVKTGARNGHRIDVQPRECASTIKLALMNVVLKKVQEKAIDLDEELIVTHERGLAREDQFMPGDKRRVREAIFSILEHSSNTWSNMFINRLGGLKATNALLKGMGYTRTRYGYHLPVAGAVGTDTVKTTTVLDMANAARDFFNTYRNVQGLGSGTAWDAFSHTRYPIVAEGHLTLGNKIGSNDFCSTNTGLYQVAGRVYAIAAFTEENGEADNHAANAITRKMTTDVVNSIASLTERVR